MSAAHSYGGRLFDQHAAKLTASAVDVEVAAERQYRTVDTKSGLRSMGFGVAQQRVPALLIPLRDVWGGDAGYQIRPDEPRVLDGKVVKYETTSGQNLVVDVHPRVKPHLGDPDIPLIITEGPIKGDALVSAGACAVALLGVWGWRGSNDDGGKMMLPDWDGIAFNNNRRVLIAFDSDVVQKPAVHKAMTRLAGVLEMRGATVLFAYIPSGPLGAKQGVDDWLATGHTVDELWATATDKPRGAEPAEPPPPPYQPPAKRTLAEVDTAFCRWLADPDLEALRANLAAVVANRASGDPVWLLNVAPPSCGKTEMLMALAGLPEITVAGRLTVAALLSGTSAKDRSADSTGGLLKVIGDNGILICKDFGSILTMARDPRAELLQALRDVFDGRYDRAVGVDGGRQLHWSGHCGFIGGTTEAIDSHHAVIAALGDRYISLRFHLPDPKAQALAAIGEGGDEEEMRRDLGEAVQGFLGHIPQGLPTIDLPTRERLAELAELAVRCRSAVERDTYSSREIVEVHRPEQPARLAKQLAKMYAALVHIGCTTSEAWRLVVRIALDSMPAGRRKVLNHLAVHDVATTTHTGVAIGLPTTVARRHLEDLEAHDVVDRQSHGQGNADEWRMSGWCRRMWPSEPEMSLPTGSPDVCTGGVLTNPKTILTDFSGTPPPGCSRCGGPDTYIVSHDGRPLCRPCVHAVDQEHAEGAA